jgi:hypothetical protein
MEKEFKGTDKPAHGFGEGEGVAHKPGKALTQRIVEAFDMCCMTGFLAHRSMLVFGNNGGIGLPQIAEADGRSIGLRNDVPEAVYDFLTS